MLTALSSPPLQTLAAIVAAAFSYVLLLAVVRVSRARLFARFNAADAVLLLVLGAVIGRGILGAVPTLEDALVGGGVLVVVRIVVGVLARSRRGRWLVEGSPLLLVAAGVVVDANVRAAHVREDELLGALRRAGIARMEEVACAVLEADGVISVTRLDARSPLDRRLFAGVRGIELVPDRCFSDA